MREEEEEEWRRSFKAERIAVERAEAKQKRRRDASKPVETEAERKARLEEFVPSSYKSKAHPKAAVATVKEENTAKSMVSATILPLSSTKRSRRHREKK